MQITFLGTSAGVPTRSRNVSCVALRLEQRGEVWLFDCGEATQHQLLRSSLKLSQITRIFITHLHGDHLFGLPGLLATCGMSAQSERIDVYGPPGIEEYLRDVAKRSETQYSSFLKAHTVEEGVVYRDEEFTVLCRPLKHRIPAYGYRILEQDRAGAFDVERAIAEGIPAGPLYGRLKRGERIRLSDGREFEGADFCGPWERGRSFVYCTDTIYCRSAVELAQAADLLVHEATFARADEGLARQSLHSTTEMAARVALEAEAKQLLITHFSPRYTAGTNIKLADLLAEARAIFPNTEMAYDLQTVEVPRHLPAS